jgi:prephenate dehydrogenase
MNEQIQKQKDTVARMKQSPCECLEYHPMFGTDIYNEYLNEWKTWRQSSYKVKGLVDKDWIFLWLLSSQDCPYIKELKTAS